MMNIYRQFCYLLLTVSNIVHLRSDKQKNCFSFGVGVLELKT